MVTIVAGLSIEEVMHWSICCFCESRDTPKCEECLGTDLDAMPWAELFKTTRVTHGPCGGPCRDY